MAKPGSLHRPSRPHWEDAAALGLLCGGGVAAWWGTLGSGLLWLAPIVGGMAAGALARWMYEPDALIDTIVVEERQVS